MSLQNFRDLLLEKANDPSVCDLIKSFTDAELNSLLVDALEKSRSSFKGADAGYAIKKFGADFNEGIDTLARDALSHHASRYKAALKANRPDIANKHMDKYMQTLNVLDKASPHSDGNIKVHYVDPKPWERNVYQERKKDDPTSFSTDTRGLNRTGAKWHEALTRAPHEAYSSEIEGHGYAKAYPLEKNKVNDKYIHIKDIDPSTISSFEGHPFDEHPVFKYMSTPKNLTAEQHAERNMRHDEEVNDYMDKHGERLGNILDEHETQKAENPDEYHKRHNMESSQVHDDVEPLDFAKNKQLGIGQGNKGSRGKAPAASSPSAAGSPDIQSMIANIRAKHGIAEPKPAEPTDTASPASTEEYVPHPELADILKRYGGK